MGCSYNSSAGEDFDEHSDQNDESEEEFLLQVALEKFVVSKTLNCFP